MQITNNQVSSYSYGANSTTQTNSTNTANFDSYLSNTNEKTTTPNNQTSKIVAFIDKYNGFSSLSSTDEKIFRDILSDGILRNEEIKDLSYEQMKELKNLVDLVYSSGESASNVPVLGTEFATGLSAINKTNNDKFNKALFETVQTINDDMERMNFLSEVSDNLGWNDKTTLIPERDVPELRKDSTKENWEIKDYKSFIQTLLSKYKEIYESPAIQSSTESLERYEKLLKSLSTLGKNYNEIKNEVKYV